MNCSFYKNIENFRLEKEGKDFFRQIFPKTRPRYPVNFDRSLMLETSWYFSQGSHCKDVNGIRLGEWTEVEVDQRATEKEGTYKYKVLVNGELVGKAEDNTNAQEFENVKVYASDPWNRDRLTSEVKIKNLVITGRK